MKKLRKLHIKRGQELSLNAKEQTFGGGSDTGWIGDCHCTMVGHTHSQTRTITFSDPDWVAATAGGGLMLLYGATIGATSGASSALAIEGILASGYLMSSALSRESTIVYHREFKVTKVNPLTHKLSRTWTS